MDTCNRSGLWRLSPGKIEDDSIQLQVEWDGQFDKNKGKRLYYSSISLLDGQLDKNKQEGEKILCCVKNVHTLSDSPTSL